MAGLVRTALVGFHCINDDNSRILGSNSIFEVISRM